VTAVALWITLALPWYHEDVIETVAGKLVPIGYTVSGFGDFSFVEASLLLVSIAVLTLLFYRGERRAFHLPGGDGPVITLAGGWQAVLIFYRMLDGPHLSTHAGRQVTTVGISWGIFVALLGALGLAYAGARIRISHRPEPALADDPTVRHDVVVARVPRPPSERSPSPRRPVTREDAEQLTFEIGEQASQDPFGDT
jgi:hypothetical protein